MAVSILIGRDFLKGWASIHAWRQSCACTCIGAKGTLAGRCGGWVLVAKSTYICHDMWSVILCCCCFHKDRLQRLCYHPCEHGLSWKSFRAGYEALILTMTMSTLPSAGQISFPACEETLRQRGVIMLYVAGCEIFWQRKQGLILNSSRWKIQSGVMWTQKGKWGSLWVKLWSITPMIWPRFLPSAVWLSSRQCFPSN